jgi:carbamoyl-phosphate synthase large subunit
MMEPQPWILAADASPEYILLALGHEREIVPRCEDQEAYLSAIRGLVQAHEIDLILPNNSLEIDVLARASETLGARTFLPAPSTLEAANSKWASYAIWREAGIPVPDTRLLVSPDTLESAFEDLQSSSGDPEGRVWVRGAGIPGKGIGVASLPCRTVEQASQWVDYWRGWNAMIASEYLPGKNLTWMGLFDRGRLVTSQGRERLAYVIPHVSPSGITGAPAISATIHDPAINRIGEAAVRAIDPAYHGVGFVDLKGDSQGDPRVTELNAGRFGTTHFFYTAAGANFPAFLVKLAMGEALAVPTHDILEAGLTWIRTLDAGPVLTTRDAIERGDLPSLEPGAMWPRVPQKMNEFPSPGVDPRWGA